MARIRTIKPGFWKDEDLSDLPPETHMLAAALLNYADDEGYFNANPSLVKAECCPLREDSVSVHESLEQLKNAGFIRLGSTENGKRYGHILTFADHQRVNRPTPSKISALDIQWGQCVSAHGKLNEDSPPEGKGREGKRKGKDTTGAARPADEPEFEEFKSLYPKRAGSQPWPNALKAIRARLREGHSWAEILEGARRYARFVRATGKENTEYVQQAATFCGPSKRFLEEFELPAPVPADEFEDPYLVNLRRSRDARH